MIEYENLSRVNASFIKEYNEVCSEVINSGWFILGNNVKTFEREFASYCNTEHFVGLANGLDALILALKVFNFEKGSEIIVPSNTYIATILSIVHSDLKPILVEPD